MRSRTARWLAWSAGSIALGLMVVGLTLSALGPRVEDLAVEAAFSVGLVAFAVAGVVIASRRPDSPIGWICLAVGILSGISGLLSDYGPYAEARSLPGVAVSTWLGTITFLLPLGFVILLYLVFPTGRLRSHRWRPVAWSTVLGITLATVGGAISPRLYDSELANPFGEFAPQSVATLVASIGFGMVLASYLLSIASLLVRLRRSSGDERQQVKWFAHASAILGATLFPAVFMGESSPTALLVLTGVALAGVPTAVGIAILRYRLYDIDLVISKTLVYGSLAVFISAVYVGVVVGIGSLVGRGDEPNLALSILATAVVAVAFQPVRDRVQRLANRLVYGRRATPYEVLSEFSHRMATSYATEDLLPRMARILGEGTGARQAVVWLRVGDELRAEAIWPREAELPASRPASDREEVEETRLLLLVQHQGETLGALSLEKSPGNRLTPTDEKLARDLGQGAGLVLRNVRLIEELRASRQRLVVAQDEERRRLERNIHDGAQQQLVALGVRMRLLDASIERDPAQARALVAQVQAGMTEALVDLRDLARGIYPPLLADQGLATALEAQARKAPIPVRVAPDGVGRYPQEVEASVYFCVLEALNNVAKYAQASRVDVALRQEDDALAFEVRDDGVGFDVSQAPRGSGLQGMADRIDAVGGRLEVRSAPGDGTTIVGRVPVRAGAQTR